MTPSAPYAATLRSCSRPRRPRAALGALFAPAFVALLLSCRPSAGRETFEGKVVGVADGDTLVVLDGTTPVRVRLHGIDCPERGQAFGAAANRLASALAFGKTVTVKGRGNDRYGRLLAEVVLPGGQSLSRELVAAGMAWHYVRYSDDETLAKGEREARKARVGIWSEADPVAPWRYRAARR
ncbi:MAG TPA: thermonuclease family protein [Thermoanaerobaculia bacterium]|nr:thermonuclease family protein [Thermoanaerobaculia bacterium]